MGTTRKAVTDKAIKDAGGGAALARKLGLKSRQAVYQWREVPSHHVLKVEEISGVSRHQLRPDLYPDESERQPERAEP